MSYFSQFTGGPAKVTQYNSGSGNYAPISTNLSWARLTLVGAGGGGGGSAINANFGKFGGYGSGGGGGGFTQIWVKLNSANYAYAVGAAGNGGTSAGSGNGGGNTTFGNWYAGGGGGGNSTGNAQQGWRANPGRGGSGSVPGGQGGSPWSQFFGNLSSNAGANVSGNDGGQSYGLTTGFGPNISLINGGGSLFAYGGTNGPGVGGAGGNPNVYTGSAGNAGYISIEEFVQG